MYRHKISKRPLFLARKNKQAFVLLELLIALSLFCLCIVPLAQLPFSALQSEIKSCQRMKLQRLADLTFAEVQAELFQRSIPWEKIDCPRERKTQLLNDTLTVSLKGLGSKQFARRCSLWTSRRKTGKNGEQYRLVTLELHLTAVHDSRFFFRRRNASASEAFRRQFFVAQIPSGSLQLPQI